MNTADSLPLLLFAKAPIAGQVKTRLQSHCSPEQAADIAEVLLESSLKNVCSNWPGKVFVSTWLDFQNPRLLALCERYNVSTVRQCEGDLGAKMHHAFEQHGYPMVIMGCDAPHITSSTLLQLHQYLVDGQSAIGPSLDGGYYIIGLSQPAFKLFADMPWGTSEVMAMTRKKQHAAGTALHELPALRDIDEWDDVLATKHAIPALNAYLLARNLV